jgi:tetrahydromethanopterin S-methyltransferase subunit G
MQALLNEVHQLRLAIQRSNLNTYHAQVTLERFRLQQQRVDRLSERLENVRAEIAEIKPHQARALEDFKQIEDELAKETDPGKRRYLEGVQQPTREKLERLIQMQEQEAQLIAQLQLEQIKLNELNERLDTLQKELEVVEKLLPSGKRQ